MKRKFLFFLMAVAMFSPASAADMLVDFWDEAPRILSSPPPKNWSKAITLHRLARFSNETAVLRYDNAKVGAFSVALPGGSPVALITNLWNSALAVPGEAKLEFWLAGEDGAGLPGEIPISPWKGEIRTIPTMARARETEGQWTRYEADWAEGWPKVLDGLIVDLTSVRAGTVLLDGVIFRSPGVVVGITDKPVEQWQTEAAATRAERVKWAFAEGMTSDKGGEYRQWFDKLWSGQEAAAANAWMREFFRSELKLATTKRAKLWDLAINVRLIQTYYELGSKSSRKPAPLEPETEALLLELLWERTKEKNDIGWAGSNTWWLTASENHDLNAKVSNLVSSRIFMNEPAYRDRTYPNAGHDPGYGYWFHVTYSEESGYGPTPGASWKPSGPHTPAEHYEAWVKFFERYITERARRGFFLERASPIYMKWSLGFIQTLRSYNGDKELTQAVTNFLDLVWAEWAQEQIAGIRGGGKTRHQHTVGGWDSMSDISRFLLGGPGTTNLIYASMLLDDYTLPTVVVDLALDSRGRGRYEFISRGIGEEEETRPRPPGTEKTLTVDRDARFLRYSWVTPDYILGTQMDHPDAVHSALSMVGRWHGLIVAGDPAARIVPTGGLEPPSEEKGSRTDMEVMYQAAQSRNVLVVQQTRRWNQICPSSFPAQPVANKDLVLHLGKAWDETLFENGWTFLREGTAFAAVRQVLPSKTTTTSGPLNIPADISVPGNSNLVLPSDIPPAWNEQKTGLILQDKFSPIIIHAGSTAEHGSFADFRKVVVQSRLELRKTTVPGFYCLVYQGNEDGAKEILLQNSAPDMPFIGGEPVEYRPKALFASPYLQSDFGSGRVLIKKGARELSLDFTRKENLAVTP